MSASVPVFGRDSKVADIAATLHTEGVAIVQGVIAPGIMDALTGMVETDLAQLEPGGGSFSGGRTKGLSGLLARGRGFSEHLLLNPCLLDVADDILLPSRRMGPSTPATAQQRTDFADSYAEWIRPRDPVLGPNCHHYRVNATAVSQVWGGGTAQVLHRETDIYGPFLEHDPQRPECVLASNWAGTDFTLENGATRVVPGSHRWPKDRKAEEHEVAQAVMPKGSVVFWLGGTLHGAAASRCTRPRTGFILALVVDWLAAEENQYLAVPPPIALTLPERAQQLVGYRSSSSLGWVAGCSGENLLVRGDSTPLE